MKSTWRALLVASVVTTLCLGGAGSSTAVNFDIQPIKIYLDGKSRIEKLTLRNLSDGAFPVQIRVYRWSQNERGEDVHEESGDVIVAPKMFTLNKGETKIVRIGTNLIPGDTEKTYRMYVEELPSDVKKTEGTNLRMYMKIGVPIFLAPLKKEEKGEIESIRSKEGMAVVTIRNTGSAHFIVTSLSVKGEDDKGMAIFFKELSGWYVLSGKTKTYEIALPPDSCNSLRSLNVQAKVGGLMLAKKTVFNSSPSRQKP